jgi:hypothetical protein
MSMSPTEVRPPTTWSYLKSWHMKTDGTPDDDATDSQPQQQNTNLYHQTQT